jgi:hypothetical protein
VDDGLTGAPLRSQLSPFPQGRLVRSGDGPGPDRGTWLEETFVLWTPDAEAP